MKITEGMSYMLTEIGSGFVIHPQSVNLKGDPSAEALVLADRENLIEYLNHYLMAREAGKPLKEAHDLALQAARIPKVIKLS